MLKRLNVLLLTLEEDHEGVALSEVVELSEKRWYVDTSENIPRLRQLDRDKLIWIKSFFS